MLSLLTLPSTPEGAHSSPGLFSHPIIWGSCQQNPTKATEPKTHLTSPQWASLMAHPSCKGPALPCLAQGGHPRAPEQMKPSRCVQGGDLTQLKLLQMCSGKRFNPAKTPPGVPRGYLEPPACSFPTPSSAARGRGEPCPCQDPAWGLQPCLQVINNE